jgi:hypothetical protein
MTCLRSRRSSAGDQRRQVPRIVKQEVVAMAVGRPPNRLKAGPNGSGVNRMDTDDILAPHNAPLLFCRAKIRLPVAT